VAIGRYISVLALVFSDVNSEEPLNPSKAENIRKFIHWWNVLYYIQFWVVSVDAHRVFLSAIAGQVLLDPWPFLHSVVQLENFLIIATLLSC
jgi:hypothetical protein